MGKENEQPSTEAEKQMREGWETFFEACGLEYVGEGLHAKLTNPLWLLLVPVVATLAAIASEFGLISLFEKKIEEKAKAPAEQTQKAA